MQQHISETGVQSRRLEDVLATLNEHLSQMKDIALSFTGVMAAFSHGSRRQNAEKLIRQLCLRDFEIAAYRFRLTIAEAGGYTAGVLVLQTNLAEEPAMAGWLEDNLIGVATSILSLREVGGKQRCYDRAVPIRRRVSCRLGFNDVSEGSWCAFAVTGFAFEACDGDFL
nr:DUF892 family protein [Ensifer adhaerens]